MNTTAQRAAVAALIEPLLAQLGYGGFDLGVIDTPTVTRLTVTRYELEVTVYLGPSRGHRTDTVRLVGEVAR